MRADDLPVDPMEGDHEMRRSAFVCAALALFLTTLALAAVAEARAGGGFSGGSRGSRSYSAPRSPSTPMSPSSPTSPQRSLSSPTQPQRPGGFLGGFGGMLGGFLLGGLLGSLLFGGLGHGLGGIGLMDILLVGGLAALAFFLFRRRSAAPAPAYAGAAGASAWTPAETAAPQAGGSSVGAAPADVDFEDLERGIAAIRTMDPAFTPLRFAALARDLFLRVQSAWTARDLSPVRGELTDELAGSLDADLGRLKALKRVNRLDKITLDVAEVTEAWQEYGKDFVSVRFRAGVLDYTVDETTGAVVEGSNTVPTGFEEFWTFTRPVGPNPWRLSAIQQPA
jgi:predicted lipid-binding transport protein (Tim44 family)